MSHMGSCEATGRWGDLRLCQARAMLFDADARIAKSQKLRQDDSHERRFRRAHVLTNQWPHE